MYSGSITFLLDSFILNNRPVVYKTSEDHWSRRTVCYPVSRLLWWNSKTEIIIHIVPLKCLKLKSDKVNKEEKLHEIFWGFIREQLWVGGNSLDVGETEREVQAIPCF